MFITNAACMRDRYLAFQIAPIFLEVGLVSCYLFSRYSPAFGCITIMVRACAAWPRRVAITWPLMSG